MEKLAIIVNKFIHEQCIDGVPHDIGWNVVKMITDQSPSCGLSREKAEEIFKQHSEPFSNNDYYFTSSSLEKAITEICALSTDTKPVLSEKQLQNLYDKHVSLFTDDNGHKAYALEYQDLKNVLSELNLSTDNKGEWISVDIEPEFGGEYNVLWDLEDGDKPVVSTMDYDKRKKRWIDTRGGINADVTKVVLFWRELPEAPTK